MLGNVLSRFKIQTKVLIFIVPFVLSIVAVSLKRRQRRMRLRQL